MELSLKCQNLKCNEIFELAEIKSLSKIYKEWEKALDNDEVEEFIDKYEGREIDVKCPACGKVGAEMVFEMDDLDEYDDDDDFEYDDDDDDDDDDLDDDDDDDDLDDDEEI
ncbi:MAG: hypothetical protein A2161_10975 [Candidatus Schekmanbacteria bacterium RBG_13_48_7]|uniref:Uncharacterized protein n=1 Tax=Candidatus Schekmanbacteria bacterium RBG_13_48_7 TaxID=1817878 RepID=A0A1F7RPX3_9BACT|nr:MAG: hypothetical protein A2161_10975 [Candidatus Schekmanbacteria bacterium RBG_13_48_7]